MALRPTLADGLPLSRMKEAIRCDGCRGGRILLPVLPRASLRTAVAKTLGRGGGPVKSRQEKSFAKSQEKHEKRAAGTGQLT